MGRLTQQGECTGKNLSSNAVVHVQNYYDGYTFVDGFTQDISGYGRGR
ncbi:MULTISPECIES: hypothetical protein [Bacteroides]|nr:MULTISPECIES: hypothetical protein [Bacteroides]MCM1628107.1 hypothetical protein [Bacteroides uniformis]MCM1630813.1 hypothetical protein [Bacteroides uniformis]MCM1665981.1 hypothetical protein [Bacteroides uniformis]MCM1701697.1 hypothetical protein [Bacteroides uniformis]MCM1840168.1 hypothetical protein [Bacteroides uniformis]